jgi:hypothetical protein
MLVEFRQGDGFTLYPGRVRTSCSAREPFIWLSAGGGYLEDMPAIGRVLQKQGDIAVEDLNRFAYDFQEPGHLPRDGPPNAPRLRITSQLLIG